MATIPGGPGGPQAPEAVVQAAQILSSAVLPDRGGARRRQDEPGAQVRSRHQPQTQPGSGSQTLAGGVRAISAEC